MGWESRERGGSYYVQKVWKNGKCSSVYVGAGETASLISRIDEMDRDRAEMERHDREVERAKLQAEHREIDAMCGAVRALLWQHLETSGYYRHNRQWRRRRVVDMALSRKEAEGLNGKARHGDAKAAGELFAAMKENGTYDEGLRLVYNTHYSYTHARCGGDLVLHRALSRKTEEMRADLLADGDTALERLLIEQVIVCHLCLMDVTSRQQRKLNDGEGMSLTLAVYYDRSVDRAQRRYLSAVQSLALARRIRVSAKGTEVPDLRFVEGGQAPDTAAA